MQRKTDFTIRKLRISKIVSASDINSFLSIDRVNVLIFISYVILTFIFTYPVFLSDTEIPGGGDAYFYLWDLWWFKKALLNLSSPYFTPYLFHPTGLNLAFSAVTPFNALLSIPLQPVFGLVRTYNILWLTSFIFAGFGTYKLTRYLTGNLQAAFIAGLIFMFSPYHFVHSMGHLNLTSIQWIPFYVLSMLKTINEKDIKNAIYSALFLFLVALSEYTYLVHLTAFTAILLLYHVNIDKQYLLSTDLIKRLSVVLTIFTFLFFPFAYPLLKELAASDSNYMYSGGFVMYSADLLGFFLPSGLHPFFKNLTDPFYRNFTGNPAEYTIFAGYTVLTLAIIAFQKVKTSEVRFWVISTLTFVIFSLGPILHINGIFKGNIEGVNYAIPLPYAIIMHMPVISIARAPSRWDVLIMLGLSVLAAYGYNHVSEKIDKQATRKTTKNIYFSIIMIAFILFEFLATPLPMASTYVPEFYYLLSSTPQEGSILEIPDCAHHLAYPEYMYYQTVHEKKITTGYTHVPPGCTKFTDNTPLINDLYFISNSSEKPPSFQSDILNQNMKEIGPSILNYYGIEYVILHENYMTSRQIKVAKTLLEKSLGEKPDYYKNDSIIVYKVESSPIKTFQVLGDGWQSLEEWNGIPTRWISSNSSVILYSDENCNAELSFNALSFHSERTLNIYKEDSLISTTRIPAELITLQIPVKLCKGENTIRFIVLERPERPYYVQGFNRNDYRALSVAIQNITVVDELTI